MLKTISLSRVSAIALTILLSGCAALPRSGPDDRAIEASATTRHGAGKQAVGIDYVLVDLDKSTLNYVEAYAPVSLRGGFGAGRGASPEIPLGPGDILSVSIFEAQSGGLFIPADAGSRPGNFVTLPQQTVDRAGNITVPYAGSIRASDRSTAEVAADVQDKLANRAIEPQVLITIASSKSNLVSVIGDVNEPKKVEISQSGERILDAIADAGGLATPGQETYVTLQRGGRELTMLYDALVSSPEENIYLRPGDTVSVQRERRTYLVFGAAESTGRVDFDDANLTLGEALGKVGGLTDTRADPGQVFLYRHEPRTTLQAMGIDLTKFPGNDIPVVYRVNLRDPSAYFATTKFPMRDKDIVYVSNSKSVELQKLLDIVNDVSTTAGGVPQDALDARNAVRSF